MKIIAYYLPQFHEIPENNEMWGKGFTEWTNVKKAKPLFKGHYQPVEPLEDNYYDLTNIDVMRWQIGLAKQYGVFGFCFYHYWYNDHKLLEKPIEMFLNNTDLDLPFCLCWANHDWTFSWVNKENTVIYSQKYDDECEWKRHFDYLLKFFKDKRYITKNNKPLLVIYEVNNIPKLGEMLDKWTQFAIDEGFDGIDYAYQSVFADTNKAFDASRFTYDIEYQPQYARVLRHQKVQTKLKSFLKRIDSKLLNLQNTRVKELLQKNSLTVFDYDDLWKSILDMEPVRENSIPGAFVNVDTTPRRQERGIISKNMTPEKFRKYLEAQIVYAREGYHSDMLFIFAWNEWAEGAYMEPDKRWKYGVLEAVRDALINTNEFPKENI